MFVGETKQQQKGRGRWGRRGPAKRLALAMQANEHNARRLHDIQPSRWYTRLGRALRTCGCWSPDSREFPTRYVPVGQLHRAASLGAVTTVESFLTSGEYHVNDTDKRGR